MAELNDPRHHHRTDRLDERCDPLFYRLIASSWAGALRTFCGAGKTLERATFIQKYFGKEWPNRHLYHLA
jgi:hypothetical protein